MYPVKIIITSLFLVASISRAEEINDAMFKNFNDLKASTLKIDITKPENDKDYLKKLEELKTAYETLNSAYWNSPKAKITVMIANATDKAALDLQFFKTPESLIKAKFNQESCYDGWYELKSSSSAEPILFEHFKNFIKARCKAQYTPGI